MRLIALALVTALAACGPPTKSASEFYETYDQRLPESRVAWPDQRPNL